MAVPIQLSYRLEVAEAPPQFRVLGPAASGYTMAASRNLIDWLAPYPNSQSAGAVHTDFKKQFTEAVKVRRRRAGSFRCDVTFSSQIGNVASFSLHFRDKPNVREFRRAPDKDDVRWLDVAVNERMFMKMLQRG